MTSTRPGPAGMILPPPMEAANQYGAFAAALVVGLAGFVLGDWAVMAWLAAGVLAAAGVVWLSPRWGTLATAVLGLGCNLYLFERKLDPSGSAICNVSAKVNCDLVNSSAASELFGIPIALFGAGFFLGVAIAALLPPGPANRLHQTVGAFSIVGCAYSVFLGFTAYQMGIACPMCMTIYACNALLLVASVLGMRQSGGVAGEPLAWVTESLRSSSMLAVAATFVATVLLGQSVYASHDRRSEADKVLDTIAARQAVAPTPAPAPTTGAPTPTPNPSQPAPAGSQDEVTAKLAEAYVKPRGTVRLVGDEPLLGDPNAPYQVLEYACFGCPHCAQALGHLKQLVAEFPEVNVRFRSFPLSGECNAAAREGRPEVCRAAMAAKCASKQGKFWDYATILFANQQMLADPLFAGAATEVGLNFDQFSACLTDPNTLKQVFDDAKSGADLEIMGTPTMFLKGAVGDDWVEVCWGAQGVAALIQADKQGIPLREAAAVMCPME